MVIVFLIPVRKQSALRQRLLSLIYPFFSTKTYMYTKLIDMNSVSLKMPIPISRGLNVTSPPPPQVDVLVKKRTRFYSRVVQSKLHPEVDAIDFYKFISFFQGVLYYWCKTFPSRIFGPLYTCKFLVVL